MLAVYAGSFDPITLGHEDVLHRASRLHERVFVAIGTNSSKKSLFLDSERIKLVAMSVDKLGLKNVHVATFSGLLVNFCNLVGATVIVRGLRAVTDFEYELGLASANRTQVPGIETVFLPTKPELAFVSSSVVKEIATHHGKLETFVSPHVEAALRERFDTKNWEQWNK